MCYFRYNSNLSLNSKLKCVENKKCASIKIFFSKKKENNTKFNININFKIKVLLCKIYLT